jgi:hypothetical protein
MRSIRLLPYQLSLLSLLFLLPFGVAHAQAPAGKAFVVTLPPWLTTNEMNSDIGDFSIEVLCSQVTHVTVRWPNGTYLANAIVQANSRLVVARPQFHIPQIVQSSESQYLDIEKINQRALIVTADKPVTVQAMFDLNYRGGNFLMDTGITRRRLSSSPLHHHTGWRSPRQRNPHHRWGIVYALRHPSLYRSES